MGRGQSVGRLWYPQGGSGTLNFNETSRFNISGSHLPEAIAKRHCKSLRDCLVGICYLVVTGRMVRAKRMLCCVPSQAGDLVLQAAWMELRDLHGCTDSIVIVTRAATARMSLLRLR